MNANALAKHYDKLTPEERFRLILAASGRGDEAERDRLVNGAPRRTVSMTEHYPYADAFHEVALLLFIELLEGAAGYLEAFELSDPGDQVDEAEDPEAAEDDGADAEPEEEDPDPVWYQWLRLALALGFMLKTKAEGWRLFCERLNVPPFLYWQDLPGFERLQDGLALAEHAALVPEGMVRWLNARRPEGKPEQKEAVAAYPGGWQIGGLQNQTPAFYGGYLIDE